MATPRIETKDAALVAAATAALRAPSIFNTQPWAWRVDGDTAELRIDRTRQLPAVDPDARFAVLSCGIALHHFTTALAAAGVHADITLHPTPDDPDLLATARVTGHDAPKPTDVRHYQTTLVRRTDRRPFSSTPVPVETIDAIRTAVEGQGAHLHVIRPDQLTSLILAANRAGAVEAADPAYREELSAWTHRPPDTGDGVPAATVVDDVRRKVPVRDFALTDGAALPQAGADEPPAVADGAGTTYAIIYTPADGVQHWLRAGEATSAALLTAVEHGAAASPMSDLLEVAGTKATLHSILSGLGEPMLVLRIGIANADTRAAATPRRAPETVIQ